MLLTTGGLAKFLDVLVELVDVLASFPELLTDSLEPV